MRPAGSRHIRLLGKGDKKEAGQFCPASGENWKKGLTVGAVTLLLFVGAVEKLVGFVAAGFAQILGVDLFHDGAFVALAVGHGLVLVVESLGPQGAEVGEGEDVGGVEGLAAAEIGRASCRERV